MVKMSIDNQYFLFFFFVIKYQPCSCPPACSIPSYRGHIRRFTQPECSFVTNLEKILLPKQDHVLTSRKTIISSYTIRIVFRKSITQIFKLILQDFLGTQ